ncbi:hypothetical protein [Neorhizobium sp. JUb45]|uniref:hypothetical protein n=1 Tax=unclassified Neorhizobium TaxID=2629175 RepID=UPI00104CAA47|nr:hypothetical protein [Neorhizobium sp. JUb45]TCR04744.1 hypothetical protein EDF70_102852 [Neorhizobium sp. JUb45]
MVIMLRFLSMLVATLFLAGGALSLEMPSDDAGQAASHIQTAYHPGKAHAARGGKYCQEAGCTPAACPMQCVASPVIVPDLLVVAPFGVQPCFCPPAECGITVLFLAPPVPPPKSPVLETMGAFVA